MSDEQPFPFPRDWDHAWEVRRLEGECERLRARIEELERRLEESDGDDDDTGIDVEEAR